MSLNSKKHAQRAHAKRRAYERYGLSLNRHQMQDLVKRIQNGGAIFIEKQSNRVSVFDLDINGEPARVVYDKTRKVIVTFFPKEALTESRIDHETA